MLQRLDPFREGRQNSLTGRVDSPVKVYRDPLIKISTSPSILPHDSLRLVLSAWRSSASADNTTP